jgi:PleD family two-component response regulator
MVALPETRLKDAAFVGEKVRERISESIFTEEKKSAYDMARLTVSVGVAEHRVGLREEELIQRVSEALLEAKHKGKNCLSIYK